MNLSPRAQELLARAQEKYLASMPRKRARIAHSWSAIQSHGWGLESSSKLKTEVHRLAGSAGSYGLDALGQAAQRLDVLLASDPEFRPSEGESEYRSVAGELMAELFQAMDQVIDDFTGRIETSTSPKAS